MKILNFIKLTTLTSALVCSQLSYSATVTVPDAEIVSNINAQIAADKTTSDLNIQVSSQSGVVTLDGKVNTDTEAEKLITIAESMQGVNDVNTSQLTVVKSSNNMSDTVITAKVKGIYMQEKVFGDKDISLMGVNVETTNGIVYLTGSVETELQATNAVKLAQSIQGVKSVDSKLEVKAIN